MFEQIKKGFFLGIGLLIPLMVLEYGAIKMATHMMLDEMGTFTEDLLGTESLSDSEVIADSVEFSNEDLEEHFAFDKSYVDKVEIVNYDHVMQGTQLLVRGSVKNIGDTELNSVELEAELYDADGKFVYECSEYISKQFKSGLAENFLIKCGCSKNGLPSFDSVNVRVANAREPLI